MPELAAEIRSLSDQKAVLQKKLSERDDSILGQFNVIQSYSSNQDQIRLENVTAELDATLKHFSDINSLTLKGIETNKIVVGYEFSYNN